MCQVATKDPLPATPGPGQRPASISPGPPCPDVYPVLRDAPRRRGEAGLKCSRGCQAPRPPWRRPAPGGSCSQAAAPYGRHSDPHLFPPQQHSCWAEHGLPSPRPPNTRLSGVGMGRLLTTPGLTSTFGEFKERIE